MSFENAVRAEFATQHVMHEKGLEGPIDLFLELGYSLMTQNPKKWKAIQKAYELDIKRCLKKGIGDREGFKFRKLEGVE